VLSFNHFFVKKKLEAAEKIEMCMKHIIKCNNGTLTLWTTHYLLLSTAMIAKMLKDIYFLI